MKKIKILAFAGSVRKESFNHQLVCVASKMISEEEVEFTQINLRDYEMPIFNQDFEGNSGKPEGAKHLKSLMKEHDAFLIASPEYNSSLPALLKNAIDWVSRPDEGEAPFSLPAFKGKVVGIMSASPGGLGGLRGLTHLRSILSSMGCIVIPSQVAISSAHNAFQQEALKSDVDTGRLKGMIQELINVATKLST